MYSKTDKRRLYWLIDQYLANNIDEREFCDEYYYCYDLELDYSTLNETEKKAFNDLSMIASRFSEFDEDHQNLTNGFYTTEQLKQKVIQTKKKLGITSPL